MQAKPHLPNRAAFASHDAYGEPAYLYSQSTQYHSCHACQCATESGDEEYFLDTIQTLLDHRDAPLKPLKRQPV